jgi:NADPH-dependent 7-cyano-7-deazaguanine reductase QueF
VTADPSLLRGVPDDTGSRVTVTGPITHRCPHVPEVDAGTITVSWVCAELTVELHSLSAYLASWAGQVVSHAELTRQVLVDLESIDGIDLVSVTTAWHTAGLAVRIEQ